jgi:glycosyltransferase involved in cell wall biosynthesis
MVDKFYFVKGGAERYFFDLKTLLESKGHEVIPFSMKHPDNVASPYSRYFVDHIDFNPKRMKDRLATGVRSAGRVVYSLQARRNVERLIKDTRPDMAHLHMIDHQLSPSILPAFRKAGIPVVQTVHTYKAVCPSYRFFIMHQKRICEKCLHGAFHHAILSRCHKQSLPASALLALEASVHAVFGFYKRYIDLFLVPSVFMGKKMAEGGYAPSKIRHLPYTIRMEDYPVRTDSDGYYVYCGRLSEEKGIETLVRAVDGAGPRRLKIIGEGPMRPKLEALARGMGLSNVEFTGSLGGKALQKEILGAEFVVVPSEWYENSPLVIYEAFTMGKPVVGARIGGIPELIEHGKDGFLFEAGHSGDLRKTIRIFLDHPGLASRMGRAARLKAEKTFEPEIHYNCLMQLYEEAVISRRRHDVE